MTRAGRYVAGVAAVGAVGLIVAAGSPPESRPGILWGLAVGLLLQAPLGWWTLRAVGTERFLMVWGLGMLVRFSRRGGRGFRADAGAGCTGRPDAGDDGGYLVALLLVEGVVAMREHSREDER